MTGREAKILLVEDDPLIVRLYQTAFSRMGYSVEVAFNGKEGLDHLKKSEPKPIVVLSDVMMPEMDGLQMLEHIKEDPALKTIPVILLTNLVDDQEVARGLELGAVTYLVKSEYKPKEIVEKVKEILAGYSHGDNVPEVKTELHDIQS